MKKAIVIITIAMCTLFVTQAKADLIVHNSTGLQMNIKLSDGFVAGITSTSGTHTFVRPTFPHITANTWPGAVAGGTGAGIVEWLFVGNTDFGFPPFATSAYTWAGGFGITSYSVAYVFDVFTGNIILYLTP